MTAVVDAGPLMAFAKIDGLEVLFKSFSRVLTAPAVFDEVVTAESLLERRMLSLSRKSIATVDSNKEHRLSHCLKPSSAKESWKVLAWLWRARQSGF